MESKIYITNSYQETQEIGERFAKRSDLVQGATLTKKKNAFVIALHGDLGSGKTTFVQGLAKGLGIERRIISPTYIIIRQYKAKLPIYSSSMQCHPGVATTTIGSRDSIALLQNDSSRQARTIKLYHIDLYRIESTDDIKGLGIEEILNNPENIVAIEWPEKMGRLLPEKRIDITFESLGEERRKITISKS